MTHGPWILRSMLAAAALLLAIAASGKKTTSAEAVSKSEKCLGCHVDETAGIVEHWRGTGHEAAGVGCWDCHRAEEGEPDAFVHGGSRIAVVVTPRDCARCHQREDSEFEAGHHSKAGNILASLDNYLAEIVEGSRTPFTPHSPTPGRRDVGTVNGLAAAQSGCQQCHGGKIALVATDGGTLTVDDFRPGPDGKPTNADALQRIARDAEGRPILASSGWPNTGIGRINLDGSLGSCAACHGRHDFSRRRARQPENCGKCHLGPDHPQKEIFEESKHGVAYRDLKGELGLDGKTWVLGKDYSQAPTCATCHVSATASGLPVTHDPGERISWTNRPATSLAMDTGPAHEVVTESDPVKRAAAVVDTAMAKRDRMKQVCTTCHAPGYVDAFYKQYDDLVLLYNEKFAKPGKAIMDELAKQGLITKKQFDERIEWAWYYLWHHEGRRARHGAAMMAPDYAHWHGTCEVAERFYQELIPEARGIAREAREHGKQAEAAAVDAVIDGILARPEHAWLRPASTPAN